MKKIKYVILLFAILFVAGVQNINSAAIEINDDKQLEKEFILAAGNGDNEKVEKCLSENINVNAIDKYGKNALMMASLFGNVEIVRTLLAHKQDDPENCVNINAVDKNGYNALAFASRWGYLEIHRMLLEFRHPRSRVNLHDYGALRYHNLITAAYHDYAEIIRMLLAHKQHDPIQRIDVNQFNNDGETALMIATNRGREDIVRLLLQYSRIDVNQGKKRI